jgi:hypothetical protein
MCLCWCYHSVRGENMKCRSCLKGKHRRR